MARIYFKNPYPKKELDEKALDSFLDSLVGLCGGYISEIKKEITLANPYELKRFSSAFNTLSKGVDASLVEMDNDNHSGHIYIKGKNIVVKDAKSFISSALSADTVGFSPSLDGSLEIVFVFGDIASPIGKIEEDM